LQLAGCSLQESSLQECLSGGRITDGLDRLRKGSGLRDGCLAGMQLAGTSSKVGLQECFYGGCITDNLNRLLQCSSEFAAAAAMPSCLLH
jgi:hypothetical protein